MIKIHHLNNSRSQRILWALEELGAEYEIVSYQRDAETSLAPDTLKQAHPLGKSPVMEDGAVTIAESGVIIDYLVQTYGEGKLAVTPSAEGYWAYQEWLHYVEGSAMLPMMLGLYVGRLGDAGGPLLPRILSEITNNLSYMSDHLGQSDYFVADRMTGVDLQITFVLEASKSQGLLEPYANLAAYVDRMQARAAYKAAVERGGPYQLGG